MSYPKISRSASFLSLIFLFIFIIIEATQKTAATATAAITIGGGGAKTTSEEEVTATTVDSDGHDTTTCSLDPSTVSDSDCSDKTTKHELLPKANSFRSDHEQKFIISLTDENFDALTHTTTPSTWLIMFKTNSCGICKKAFPILESLAKDSDIVRHNSMNEIDQDSTRPCVDVDVDERKTSEEGKDINTANTEHDATPKGPIYIATIDAGWSGRDTTKRFEVDATPTIIILRNEGYCDTERHVHNNNDSRSYYIFRGQRATYPLRTFVLGGYTVRKQIAMPPPLNDDQRKPVTLLGQIYEYIISPSTKWIGNVLINIIIAWFVFIGVLGLFLRIHNYAWGGEDDGNSDVATEIEMDKARGREEYNNTLTTKEKIDRRQQKMWERKEQNRTMFAAKREAKLINKNETVEEDLPLQGVGVAVKKTDVKNILHDLKDSSNKAKIT